MVKWTPFQFSSLLVSTLGLHKWNTSLNQDASQTKWPSSIEVKKLHKVTVLYYSKQKTYTAQYDTKEKKNGVQPNTVTR